MGNISVDGVDLVRRLLTFNPDKRLCAQDALKHRWINLCAPRAQVRNDIGNSETLANLKKFHIRNKFEKRTMAVVAHTLSESELEELKQLFIALDVNGDGQLAVDE